MGIEEIKDKILSSDIIIGGQVVEMRSTVISEIYAAAGFDFILIDQEHSAIDLSEASEIIRVARLCNIAPFIRVPEISYQCINPLLDQGVQGIVVPRVTSRNQVIELLEMIRYYPLGRRGWGPSGACVGYSNYNASEYINHANKSIILAIQLESESAINDIDNIISVPGIDVVIVGANDLSLTLGRPCQLNHQKIISLVNKVIDKCKKYKVVPGIAGCDMDGFCKWVSSGIRFLWVQNEVKMILSQSLQAVQKLKESERRT